MDAQATVNDTPSKTDAAEERLAGMLPDLALLQGLLTRRIGSRQEAHGIVASAKVLLAKMDSAVNSVEALIGE
jgi:hypothetical protein